MQEAPNYLKHWEYFSILLRGITPSWFLVCVKTQAWVTLLNRAWNSGSTDELNKNLLSCSLDQWCVWSGFQPQIFLQYLCRMFNKWLEHLYDGVLEFTVYSSGFCVTRISQHVFLKLPVLLNFQESSRVVDVGKAISVGFLRVINIQHVIL